MAVVDIIIEVADVVEEDVDVVEVEAVIPGTTAVKGIVTHQV